MPQTLQQPAETLASPFRIRWSRADCARFVADGLLTTVSTPLAP